MSDYDRGEGLKYMDANAPFPPIACHYYVLFDKGAIIIREVDAAEYFACCAKRPDSPTLFHERDNLVIRCSSLKMLTEIDWAAVKRSIDWMLDRGAKRALA